MLLLKLPFSAFVQLTKNWITSPNIRLYQLQWDNYHHGIHKTLYFQNEIINQSCLWDWSKGKYLQDDSQSCLFSRGVGVFDLIFLRHFLTKMRSFCAHQKGNFLNFSKLTLLLSLDYSWCPQWPIRCYRAFFLGHPVELQNHVRYFQFTLITIWGNMFNPCTKIPLLAFWNNIRTWGELDNFPKCTGGHLSADPPLLIMM